MSDRAGAAPIAVERIGRAVVARPQVKMMDDGTLRTLTRLIDEVGTPDAGIETVILDLACVKILPSLALGMLVQISNNCKGRQQKLRLIGVQPQIRQVFAVTRLDQVFQLAESVEAAATD